MSTIIHLGTIIKILCTSWFAFEVNLPSFPVLSRMCKPGPLWIRASWEPLHFLRECLCSRGIALAAADDGDAAVISICNLAVVAVLQRIKHLHATYGLGNKVIWELSEFGLQLSYASSMAESVYKTTFGAWGQGDCDRPFVLYSKLLSNASVNVCHQPD